MVKGCQKHVPQHYYTQCEKNHSENISLAGDFHIVIFGIKCY